MRALRTIDSRLETSLDDAHNRSVVRGRGEVLVDLVSDVGRSDARQESSPVVKKGKYKGVSKSGSVGGAHLETKNPSSLHPLDQTVVWLVAG